MSYILPKPKRLKWAEGSITLNYESRILLSGTNDSRIYDACKDLKKDIKKATGLDLRIGSAYGDERKEDILIVCKGNKDNQAYNLSIDDKGIVISAASELGLFYGIVSLRQIVKQEGRVLNYVDIKDEPDFKDRGFYHDASRGRILKLEAYKRLADYCVYYKLNQLQLYVEHTFMFSSFSEVWRDDTPLTPEDILELDEYCKNRFIDLVPSFSSFGHFYKVLRTAKYNHLSEIPNDETPFSFDQRMRHHTLNVSLKESYKFVCDMIDECMPLFSSKYFNICADETFDLGKGESKKVADKIGVQRMYVDFLNKVANYVVKKGKTPMFWGDIILKSPEYASELPSDIICLNWGYAYDQNEDQITKMARTGLKQYVCPGVHGWRHLINRIDWAYANISLMAKYGIKHKAIGMLNTDWGDYGHVHDPRFSIIGLIYGASFSWSGVVEEKEINEAISKLAYGDSSGKLINLMRSIANHEAFYWEHFVWLQELFDGDASVEQQVTCRKDFLKADYNSQNKKIDKDIDALSKLSIDCNREGKELINSLVLHAKGQKLMHLALEKYVELYLGGKKVNVDKLALADDIEKWCYFYKQYWRSSSRESELYRSLHVFYRYADKLRKG